MNLSLINPYIRLATESKLPSGHSIRQRSIYDYELIYLESGSFTLIYDSKGYNCSPGDVIFIRPGVEHSFLIDRGDISQPHVHFDLTHRPQSDRIPISFKSALDMSDSERALIHEDYFAAYKNSPILTVKNKIEFLECFYRIVSRKEDALTKKSLMIQLISLIIRDNFRDFLNEDEKPSVVYQIKSYIDAGNGLGMCLDEFERAFYQSKFHLERKFKEAFGVGIIEYRNEKRMSLAAALLEKSSVSEVAEKLGYESIYSFSRAFKLHYGYAPSRHFQEKYK